MNQAKDIAIYKIDGTKVNQSIVQRKKQMTKNDIILIMMASLSVIFLAVFAYAPLYGLVLAFKAGDGYLNILHAINRAPYVGFANFQDFLQDPDFINIMYNTLGLNLIQLLINFPAPIIFAILMSELMSDKFKKKVQTITFFPHFISWVIFGGIFLSLLDFETGIVNTLLVDIGLIKEPLDILGGERYFWGLIVISSLIKGLGWGSVIYVAAISGIPQELYEAAKVDGANRFQRIIHITIPSILPTIVLFFILSIAGILNNGIEHLWVFQNANNITRSEVLDTFIYKYGIPQWRYSYATAIGMLKSIISLLLLIGSNSLLKKLTGKGIY